MTNVGHGLLFPFAIDGILNIGLVIGSIRSLLLCHLIIEITMIEYVIGTHLAEVRVLGSIRTGRVKRCDDECT